MSPQQLNESLPVLRKSKNLILDRMLENNDEILHEEEDEDNEE
jgi:hypothetical protein